MYKWLRDDDVTGKRFCDPCRLYHGKVSSKPWTVGLDTAAGTMKKKLPKHQDSKGSNSPKAVDRLVPISRLSHSKPFRIVRQRNRRNRGSHNPCRCREYNTFGFRFAKERIMNIRYRAALTEQDRLNCKKLLSVATATLGKLVQARFAADGLIHRGWAKPVWNCNIAGATDKNAR